MLPEDLDYYHRRAEAQLILAEKADCSIVVAAHCAIAERYLEYCEPDRERAAAARDDHDRLRPIEPEPAA